MNRRTFFNFAAASVAAFGGLGLIGAMNAAEAMPLETALAPHAPDAAMGIAGETAEVEKAALIVLGRPRRRVIVRRPRVIIRRPRRIIIR